MEVESSLIEGPLWVGRCGSLQAEVNLRPPQRLEKQGQFKFVRKIEGNKYERGLCI